MAEPMLSPKVGATGVEDGRVKVSIGARFLELFSEHLYSSPNKAFEELVANSWDAGASTVYVGVPENLSDEAATIWVLDNGESMDLGGFQVLWALATEEKRRRPPVAGRPQIGKFGVGKLATYILAQELTYVCKAADGVIRAVAMDYGRINEKPDALHLEEIPLSVRKITEEELRGLLVNVVDGARIFDLISQGVPTATVPDDYVDEFGRDANGTTNPSSRETWTLALMSSLKLAGRELQRGRIGWMLRTALPLGSSISLILNGEPLQSSKLGVDIAEEWVLGKDVGIEAIEVDGVSYEVTEHISPEPHVSIQGVEGHFTGRVRLYEDRISGGKSAAVGSSNGFFVNVLGRVVNVGDPNFGLENLNHAAWAKFRATIRGDGLDRNIGVNREDLQDTLQVKIFRAFLRALFNKARTTHDAAEKAAWPDAGAVLQDKWQSVPLEPLRQVVAQGLGSTVGLPDFVDASGVSDPESALEEWEALAQERPGDLIDEVQFEPSSRDEHLVRYNLVKRRVLVNTQHPFFMEYGDTRERKELLRDTALVELLTDAFMSDIGLAWEQHRRIREYRDQVLRLVARVSRRSGAQIAELLLDAKVNWRGLEIVVGEALYYLGFDVEPIGGSDKPDGVAMAPLTPKVEPTIGDVVRTYKFTYDTKFSKSGKAKTGNLSIAGLARHRKHSGADHVLVVAPGYQKGSKLLDECADNEITPMRTDDLAKLLMLVAAKGPLDAERFREVFSLTDPDKVSGWVAKTIEAVEAESPLISYDQLLDALESIGYSTPDAVHISLIADRLRQMNEGESVISRQNVRSVLAGLSVLVPNLVQLTSDGDVFLSAPPRQLREAISRQLSGLPAEYRLGLEVAVEETKS
jgi:hypothetical protein